MAALNRSRLEAIQEWEKNLADLRSGRLSPKAWQTLEEALAYAEAALEEAKKL